MAESGHAGKPDTVGDLPVGLARWVIADTDDSVAVGLPKLWRLGEHPFGEARWNPIKPMTRSALLAIDMGADLQVGRAGFDRRRLDQFASDAGMQRDVHDCFFKGERFVAGRYRWTPGGEIEPDPERKNQQTDHHSQQEFHSVSASFSLCSASEQDIARREML